MAKIDLNDLPCVCEINEGGVSKIYCEQSVRATRENDNDNLHVSIPDGCHYAIEFKNGDLIRIFNSEWASLEIQKGE